MNNLNALLIRCIWVIDRQSSTSSLARHACQVQHRAACTLAICTSLVAGDAAKLTMRGVPSLPGCTGIQSLPMSRVCRWVSSRQRWLRTFSGNGTLRSPAKQKMLKHRRFCAHAALCCLPIHQPDAETASSLGKSLSGCDSMG